MAEYMVLDVNPSLRRVALLDRANRHHVLSMPESLPERGEFLLGPDLAPAAADGLQMLVGVASGQVYRAVFEARDCDQLRTFEWLHPAPVAVPPAVLRAAPTDLRTAPTARNLDLWDGVIN